MKESSVVSKKVLTPGTTVHRGEPEFGSIAEQKQLARRFDPIRDFELVETFPELCLFLHKGAALARKLFLGDEFLAAQAGQVIEALDARRERLLCGSFDFGVGLLLRLMAHHRERFLQLVAVEIDSVDEFQNLAV